MPQWVKVPKFDFSLDTPIGLYTVLLMNKIVYRGGIQKPNHQTERHMGKIGETRCKLPEPSPSGVTGATFKCTSIRNEM